MTNDSSWPACSYAVALQSDAVFYQIVLFFHYFNKEGKFALVLSSAARHKDVVTTSALDVRCSFTPQHLNRRGQYPLCPLGTRVGGPPNLASDAVEK